MADHSERWAWVFGIFLITVIVVCLIILGIVFQARLVDFDARLYATMSAVR